MASRKGNVNTEMKAFPTPSIDGAKGLYHRVGGVPVKYAESGVSKTPTPTQTVGIETRAPRPGTKQHAFGKSDQ